MTPSTLYKWAAIANGLATAISIYCFLAFDNGLALDIASIFTICATAVVCGTYVYLWRKG